MLFIKRFLKLILLLVSAALLLVACSNEDVSDPVHKEGYETLEFKYLGSPGMVTLVELAEDLGYLAPVKLNFVGISTGGPQGIQTVLTGDSDISSPAFNGAVVKVVASKAPVKAVIASYGTEKNSLTGYYVLANSPIKSARDLIGKTVAVNTMGAQMEFMLTEYLRRSGLSKDEVAQVTLIVIPPGSSEQTLRQHQVDVAPLGGPATERGGVRMLFNEYDLFGEFTAGAYVMSNKFLQKNPNTSRQVIAGIAKAIEWTRTTPRDQVIARFTDIMQARNRNENMENLQYFSGWGVAGKGGLFKDEEFQVWVDWLVQDGQLEQGDINLKQVYSNEFNPFLNAAANQI
ncbi:MAG: ABC transporter substrate-binding protein [Methyloprofundus sp.]|nr:ABC transporter substrate-binding protein [Methyloprofundus sp.]